MATNGTRDASDEGPIRVVVASSDRLYADTLTRLLERAGASVTRCAPAAPQAMVFEQIGHCDVLVVETDGGRDEELELVASVRAVSPLVEVIAISSEAKVPQAVRGFRSGLFAVMEHAAAARELTATVAAAARRKRRAERRIRELDRGGDWQSRRTRGTDPTPEDTPGGERNST